VRRGTPVLELRDVEKRYGSLAAVDGVSLTVEEGERRAIIGPNGAGKTTLFDLVGGRQPVSAGHISLRGEDITRVSEHERARRGIAKTFQRSNLFEGLSARDNVAISVQRQQGVGFRLLRRAESFHSVEDRARELLELVGLRDKQAAPPSALSHGERRQLEIALALAMEPQLLLLDEPVAGMSSAETEAFVRIVESFPAELTVLIIEHDMDVVFALASRITVLHAGLVLAEGDPGEVRANEDVQEAYLGRGEAEELFQV
jgi:branched-chain amino acid transport system ATP-binding protein